MSESKDDLVHKFETFHDENPDATLSDIEDAVDQELAKVRQTLIQKLVQEKESVAKDSHICPSCAGPMMKNGKKKRQLQTKEGKVIEINRVQLRCHQCGMTIFPPR